MSQSIQPKTKNPEIEEEQLIFALIKQWPCYSQLNSHLTFTDLLNLYCEDKLTISQQYVIDFVFHTQDPNFLFNISDALYIWDKEDCDFFFLFIKKQAEILKDSVQS